MNRIGLHVRLDTSLHEVAEKAKRLELPFFQCFFMSLSTNKLIKVTQKEIDEFLKARHAHFKDLYVHGSYWINLASLEYNGYRALQRELNLAKKLAFTHIVLHPGVAKGGEHKIQGIDALARALNKLLVHEDEIKIVLENTAHGNLSVGSDITDFKLLQEKMDKPEKLYFSIDTSHAYSYGYNIANDVAQDEFITLIGQTIGFDRIALIHLNDTKQKCGSRIDRHSVPGEGSIGDQALKRFIFNEKLLHIPVVMELPVLPEEDESAILQKVRNWQL